MVGAAAATVAYDADVDVWGYSLVAADSSVAVAEEVVDAAEASGSAVAGLSEAVAGVYLSSGSVDLVEVSEGVV